MVGLLGVLEVTDVVVFAIDLTHLIVPVTDSHQRQPLHGEENQPLTDPVRGAAPRANVSPQSDLSNPQTDWRETRSGRFGRRARADGLGGVWSIDPVAIGPGP